jgi:hypothetical protein
MVLPKNRDSNFVLEWFDKNKEDEFYEIENVCMENFFEYANSKEHFKTNKAVDSKVINIGTVKLQVNLINTVPFSTLKKDGKELHYLPDKHLFSLVKKEEIDLAISVMHHSTEWFHYKAKDSLEKMLRNNSDIVFHGHEHSVRTVQSEGFVLSKGGEFSGAMTHKSTFSILTYDSETRNCTETEFVWNEEQTMFNKHGVIRTFIIPDAASQLTPNDGFFG